MKFLSLFYTIFLTLFAVVPLCATTRASEKRFSSYKPSLGLQLRTAAFNGSLTEVESLLAQGACVDGDASYNVTPFYLAIQEGHVEVVRLLLARGVNMNDGRFLAKAVAHGHVEIVSLLLDAGAQVLGEVYARTKQNAGERWTDIVKLLIAAGVDTNNIKADPAYWVLSHQQDVVDILEEINAFFANPAGTIEILEQLPPQEKWQEIMVLLGASISQGREDLVAMLMQAAPEFKSALKQQAYTVAKRVGQHSIKNKMFTLRQLAKDRVKNLG